MTAKNHRLSQKYPKEMQQLDKLVEGIQKLLPVGNSDTIPAGSKPGELLSKFTEDLQRARKEFDALMFFTVCFGMLKSGKSTLVNLLAGHPEVSPTRFGQDTTLRPCLLLAGDKDELTTFHMKDSAKVQDSGEAEKKCFNAVIDFLRGVIDEKQLQEQHHVISKSKAFSEDNVFKAVCTEEGFGTEPLITVVRINNPSSLLQSEIALLDVPGLDSDQMKPENSRYLELLDRCDLLLFIQSTVSALNHGAAGMLGDLVKRSKGSPIWLIQNRFEAQNWRRREQVEEQDSRLVKVARTNLATALGVPEQFIFSKQVNLGKAYDATFREAILDESNSPKDLLEESGFDEVVQELSSKINTERLDIQLANCLNQLKNTVEKNQKILEELEDWVRVEKQQLYAFRKEFDQLIARFSLGTGFVPIPSSSEDGGFYEKTRSLVKIRERRWEKKIQDDFDDWKSAITEKMVGDEFNEKFQSKMRKLFSYGPDDHLSRQTSFGTSVAEIFRKFVENSSHYTSLIEESQEVMRKFRSPLLEEHFPDWKSHGGALYLDVKPKPPTKVSGGRHIYFAKKKVGVDACHSKIKEGVSSLKEAIGRYVKLLNDDEIDNWFRSYRDDQLAEFFNEQIRDRRNTKESEAKKLEESLNLITASLPDLRKSLGQFEVFVNNFRTKYNLG